MLIVFSLLLSGLGWTLDLPKNRCLKDPASAPAPRFPVVQTLSELQSQFEQLYASDTRLNGRVFWDEKEQGFLAPYANKTIRVPTDFIEAVSAHLKIALERGYANFPFYSDMGHGHLLYSNERWGSLSKEEDKARVLENLLKAKSEKILYHTAELLQLRAGKNFNGDVTDDPWLQWRYYSRNFTGDLREKENVAILFAKNQKYNTVREIEGFGEWNTFYFSANKNGCFPIELQGRTLFFDLSFTL